MKAIAIYNCTADDDEELSFKEGDILTDVKKSNEDGWYEGRLEATNTRGLFPYNYVKFITESATSKAIPRSTLGASSNNNNTATMDNQFSASVSPPNSTLSSTWSVISTRDDDTIDHHHHHHQSTPAPPLSSSSATRPLYPPMSATMTATSTTPPPPPTSSFNNNNNNDKALKAADAFEKAMMQQQKPATLKPTSKPAAGTSVVPLTLTEDKDHKPATAPKPAQLRKTSISSPSSSVASRVRSFSTSAAQHNDTSDTTRPRNNSNAMPIIRPKPYATKSTASSTMVNRPGKMNNGTSNREQRMEKVIFDNDVVEDDDGYQVVTPSLLRQRQPSSMITTKSAPFGTKPVLPTPSKMAAAAAVGSKPIMSDTKPFFVAPSSSSSPSPASSHKPTPVTSPTRGKQQSSKLADLPTATNPAPKLPSRPTSTASRRPRSSRSTSTTPSVSKTNTPSPTINAAIIEKKQTPPAPHPKPPQLSQDTSSSPTSPRAKGRSVSNPPPLQPKPSFSAKQHAIKPEVPVQSKPEVIRKPPPPPTQATTPTPALPVRPVAARREQFEQSENTTNRARSKSNGWKPPSTTATTNTPPLLPARTNAIPVAQRQPPPPPSSIMEKKTPPPPPPSRPVQSTYRYEELFNAINDDGIVDGETARVIWKRSKVPDDVLARIWQQCDPKGCGMLNKAAFIQGMREIDTVLAQKSFA
ncbi:hypothetical protein O0I10_006770 [Lichtheimia ornata]|uniref:SH3 domain-containing protein n=1 Tax=Lichtheimia ornata TaxID=688661 RepID=A0AAD7V1A4_9FUNG|nr:uncharacterized protein O0I10_006770 [Lichtheimia ornata]KAJ8657468.1 hypothetical protein O0I10_006770 [Lichtheimia ornata]